MHWAMLTILLRLFIIAMISTLSLTKENNFQTLDIPLKTYPRVNTPPNITCPNIPSVFHADKAKVTTRVSWGVAFANDAEDGILTVEQTEGQNPGTEHEEGQHKISYLTRDSGGLVAVCQITFSVNVLRCPFEFTYLFNGQASCQPPDHKGIYGSICSYKCNPGYELSGVTSVQCLNETRWTNGKPTCEPVSCEMPDDIAGAALVCSTSQHTYQSLCVIECNEGYIIEGNDKIACQADRTWTTPGQCKVKNCDVLEVPKEASIVCTDETSYNSKCTFTCGDGYELEGASTRVCSDNGTWSGEQPQCIAVCPVPAPVPHGIYNCESGRRYSNSCVLSCDVGFTADVLFITCNSTLKWTDSGNCLDTQAPTFPNGCPSDIRAIYQGQPTSISYELPSVKDNSNTAKLSGEPVSGSKFDAGDTVVTITASDAKGNNASCQFTIRLSVLSCGDPHKDTTSEALLEYDCPYGHQLGSSCTVSCSDGKPVKGTGKITCSIVEGYDDIVRWSWIGDTAPYCQDLCHPGQSSANGTQPCLPCQRGTYQPNFGNTSCELCRYGMSTYSSGAVSAEECDFFDLPITLPLAFPKIEIYEYKPSKFTILAWAQLVSNEPKTELIFYLEPVAGAAILTIDAVGIYMLPEEVPQSRSIRTWYHLCIVHVDEEVTVYVDGEVLGNVSGLWVSNPSSKTFTLAYVGNAIRFINNDIVLGSLQMIADALTHDEVKEFATSCGKKARNNVLAATKIEPTISNTSTCDAFDDCQGNPCGIHGSCFDREDGFVCVCDTPWSGELCQIQPDYCANNLCANGADCVSRFDYGDYICKCPEDSGYRGDLCHEKIENESWGLWSIWSSCSASCGFGQRSRSRQCNNTSPNPGGEGCYGATTDFQACFQLECPVNGEYGDWSDWSSCSVSCGGGVATRTRVCDSPAPNYGGAECDQSEAVRMMQCNAKSCPECPNLLLKPGYGLLKCADKNGDGSVLCGLQCPLGTTVMPPGVEEFRCAGYTNYTWLHQTESNPTGILPICSEMQAPSNLTFTLDISYSNMTCKSWPSLDNLTMSVKEKLEHNLVCLKTIACDFTATAAQACLNDPEEQHAVNITVSMGIRLKNESTPNYLSSLSEEEMLDETELANEINRVADELTKTSESIFNLNLNGEEYSASIEEIQMSVQCQAGAGFYDGFCVDCPTGMFLSENSLCMLCDKGYYQDQNRSTSCKECPECLTTLGMGSYSPEHCQVEIDGCNSTFTKVQGGDTDNKMIFIIVGGACGGIVLITVLFIIIRRTYTSRTKNTAYDTPDHLQNRDEDPYATIPADGPYEVISDNPYDSAGSLSEVMQTDNSFNVSNGYLSHYDMASETGKDGIIASEDDSSGMVSDNAILNKSRLNDYDNKGDLNKRNQKKREPIPIPVESAGLESPESQGEENIDIVDANDNDDDYLDPADPFDDSLEFAPDTPTVALESDVQENSHTPADQEEENSIKDHTYLELVDANNTNTEPQQNYLDFLNDHEDCPEPHLNTFYNGLALGEESKRSSGNFSDDYITPV